MALRRSTWILLVLAGTSLSGCAALDLLGGQLPGEDDEAAPLVDVTPYPPPRRIEARREPAAAPSAKTLQPPAPVVNASQDAPTPAADSATTQETKPVESPPAETPATSPTADSTPPVPAAEPQAPVDKSALEQPAETQSDQEKSEPGDELAEPEPTAEERLSVLLTRRDELIGSLEEEVKLRRGNENADGELLRLQQQLRLLYLLAERPDDAVGEIESLPAAEQEAFKQLMFGLSTWLSTDEQRRPTLRNARILRSLKDASAELAAAAKLDVKNLRFCESVEGFGWYKEFPTVQFRPKQQVILYAEVDNFASQKKGSDTYETELAVSYQIFDGSGTIVDERELPVDKETCRNQRRDYFLAYRIYLPDGIAPGRYRLELTVEDLKSKEHYQGRKLGDGQVEFAIR